MTVAIHDAALSSTIFVKDNAMPALPSQMKIIVAIALVCLATLSAAFAALYFLTNYLMNRNIEQQSALHWINRGISLLNQDKFT